MSLVLVFYMTMTISSFYRKHIFHFGVTLHAQIVLSYSVSTFIFWLSAMTVCTQTTSLGSVLIFDRDLCWRGRKTHFIIKGTQAAITSVLQESSVNKHAAGNDHIQLVMEEYVWI